MNSVIGSSKEKYAFHLKLVLSILICIAVIVLILNITFVCIATENTFTSFCITNIVLDIVAIWSFYAVCDYILIPKYKLYKLAISVQKAGEYISGIIKEVGESVKYKKFDCVQITLDVNGETRKLFAVEKTLDEVLIEGNRITAIAVENIVIEAGA